jgi:crotonobetainyl-CoA:carnitine CoA-transferase CaiB-like acyl-CoA transferase
MADVMASFVLVEHGAAAIPEPPLAPAGYRRVLVPTRRPQRTLDGWASVLPYTRDNYHDLFREGGRDDLVGDERVRSAQARVANAGELYEVVEEIVATRTTAQWSEFCARTSIPMSPVASLDDLVAGLPLAGHPVAGAYHVIPQPVRITPAGEPAAGPAKSVVRRPAALPGEHTGQVLAELGLSAEQIELVRAEAEEPTRQRRAARSKEKKL